MKTILSGLKTITGELRQSKTNIVLRTGLVSVTFRRLEAEKIIEIAAENILHGIEWGGDVHVPPDDFKNTERVFELTRQAGLEVAAYGSYFRLGSDHKFENVLQTAEILQTKILRVWAGERGSVSSDDDYRNKIIDESKRICDLAAKKEIFVVYEFHSNTLNDRAESCLELLNCVTHPNVKTYWQPLRGENGAENLRQIEMILPFIAGIHVFHWVGNRRLPLNYGSPCWKQYFEKLKKVNGFALLEFVKADDADNLKKDAETLRKLLTFNDG